MKNRTIVRTWPTALAGYTEALISGDNTVAFWVIAKALLYRAVVQTHIAFFFFLGQASMSSFADSVNITHYIAYAIAPSVIILSLLAFLQNRRLPNRCGYHKPSLVVPMRFLDGYEDRWAYALSFGAITGVLISVFLNSFISSSGEVSSDSANMFCAQTNSTLCTAIWAKTLLLQAQALVASLVCAPHFACITTSHRLVGAVCGLLYSTFWLVVYMQGVVASIRAMSDKTVGALMLLRDLPIIPCFIGLALRSLWAAYVCYKTRTLVIESQEPVVVDHQVKHVRALFAPLSKDVQDPTTLLEKLKIKVRSQLYPFFKLPTRIVSIAFVQLIVIYYAALTLTPIGVETRRLVNFLLAENNSDRHTIIAIFEGVWITASLLGVISSVIYVILFVINYRHNVIYIYKGRKSNLMEGSSTAHKLMAQSLRLPGYQIAYIVWGLVVMFGAVAVIGAILAFGIFFLAKLDLLTSVLQSLAQTLSVPAITIGLFYLQVLFVRLFLMQPKLHPEDKGPPLNVNNRRLYEVFSYVLLFSNLLVGLASALSRTIKGFILGLVFLGRLDRCLLMKGFEGLDPGYMAYVGTLLVDNAHNNPCMRVFCAVLTRLSCREDQKAAYGIQFLPEPPTLCSNSKAARRWHLAYTLVKNPDLLSRRKLALLLTRGLEESVSSNDPPDAIDKALSSGEMSAYSRQRWREENDCVVSIVDSNVDTGNTTTSSRMLKHREATTQMIKARFHDNQCNVIETNYNSPKGQENPFFKN